MKYFIISLCLLVICSGKRKPTPINQITKIEFARSGAWQDWGAAISIDSTLTYKYYGGKEHDRHYYIGKISHAFWDTLNKKLEKINLNTAYDEDVAGVVDVHYYELIIYWNGHRRRFMRSGFVVTDSLSRFAAWINRSNKSADLHLISNSINFETTFQNPPTPNVKNIKFPPPEEK